VAEIYSGVLLATRPESLTPNSGAHFSGTREPINSLDPAK